MIIHDNINDYIGRDGTYNSFSKTLGKRVLKSITVNFSAPRPSALGSTRKQFYPGRRLCRHKISLNNSPSNSLKL